MAQPLNESSFKGPLDFGVFWSTHCLTCAPPPWTMSPRTLDSIGEQGRGRVQPLFITLDPSADTLEVSANTRRFY